MTEQDLWPLHEFISELHDLMGWIVRHPEGFIPLEDREALEDAWVGLQERFDDIHQGVHVHEEKLGEAGLTGTQAVPKFKRFRRAVGRFWRNVTGPKRDRLLKRVFEWADRILGSLGGVPGVEIVKEMKETFEGFLADAEDEPEDQRPASATVSDGLQTEQSQPGETEQQSRRKRAGLPPKSHSSGN